MKGLLHRAAVEPPVEQEGAALNFFVFFTTGKRMRHSESLVNKQTAQCRKVRMTIVRSALERSIEHTLSRFVTCLKALNKKSLRLTNVPRVFETTNLRIEAEIACG